MKEGEATYGCKDDYALSGNKKRYCQRNGEWTGRDPSCVEGTCIGRDISFYIVWSTIYIIY